MPLAPPGTKIIIHNKPAIRGSWATHGYEGWYIGPASNHYRCHTVYANHTAHKQVADTVEFFPHYGKMPYRSSTENATIIARELMHALQNPTPASPFSNIGDKQMEALHQLAKLFQQAVTKNNNTPNSVVPPTITQTRQAPQPHIQTALQKHDAHPHRTNIIKDDNGNQPQKFQHEDPPLGLVPPPQQTPHRIPPDYETSSTVTPSPKVEKIATIPNAEPHPSTKLHLNKVRLRDFDIIFRVGVPC